MSESTYSLFQKGREHLKRGHAAAATVSLEKAKRREPDKASIREALGIAYFRIRRWEAAEAEFRACVDLSPTIAFDSWDALTAARKNPASAGAGEDAEAVEGVMLKRRDALYLPGRPKGQWWKWKRDPHIIDAVLMYAQRGHGKRSSYYSDYTFGVWTTGEDGEQLVPVGKAYFGFTDEELLQIDRFVRRNTVEKFGPVREVVHEPDQGLVLEVAFEGLQRSPRHKSGVAMRFPRINRLRWDKPPREADRLETLERMLKPDAIQAVAFSSESLPRT